MDKCAQGASVPKAVASRLRKSFTPSRLEIDKNNDIVLERNPSPILTELDRSVEIGLIPRNSCVCVLACKFIQSVIVTYVSKYLGSRSVYGKMDVSTGNNNRA